MEPPSKKPKPPSSSAGGRVFPPALIFNILSRLPVKSLLRFRNVSDHWRTLTSQEDFKSVHLSRSPSSIYIHLQHHPKTANDYALYTCTPPNQPSVVDFPDDLFIDTEGLSIIGSTQNGIVCISFTSLGDRIALWNPATRSTTTIPSPTIAYDPVQHRGSSVGFGYDPTGNGIVIVRILCQAVEGDPDEAEIYSLNLGQWEIFEFEDYTRFSVYRNKCDVVVHGVPYWGFSRDVVIDETVMVSFSPATKSFNLDPFEGSLPSTSLRCYCEIMGCLALVVQEEKDSQFLDIWIQNNENHWWSKFRQVEPFNYRGVAVGTYGETGIVLEIEDEEEEDAFFYLFDFESQVNCRKLEFQRSVVLGICDVVRYKESLYSIQ